MEGQVGGDIRQENPHKHIQSHTQLTHESSIVHIAPYYSYICKPKAFYKYSICFAQLSSMLNVFPLPW